MPGATAPFFGQGLAGNERVRRAIFELSLALTAAALTLLCGCVAGPNPLVGYPTGESVRPPRLLSSSSPRGGASTKIYEQAIDHNYRLLLSPEGGRASIPLKSSYRYLIQAGDQPKRELEFLRSTAGRLSEEHFTQVYSVTGEKWVGYGRCAGAPDDSSALSTLQTEEERKRAATETSRYFISVFSPERLLSRESVTTSITPEFAYRPAIRALRFHGPSGWMLYLVDEGRTLPEPLQPGS
jgi:hypothetical protein